MPDGLELESRRRIYDFLTANPGVHLRKIGQVLGMSTGMLSYHLGYLERNGILKSEEDGHRKRYFIARAFVEAQRRILAVLRQDVPRKIVLELLLFGERTFGELQASVGVSKSTLSYHLQKLMHREVLLRGRRERESVFSIKDLEEVRKLLLANQSSFQDDAVDRFADLWTKIRDRKSTRLNSSHLVISYAVFCLKKKIGPDGVFAVARYVGEPAAAWAGNH